MAVVGILTFEDVEELDFIGPLEVFGIASRMGADCRVIVASVDGHPVRCRNGLRIVPDCSMNELPELAILVVPGGLGARTHARTNPGIRELVRRQKGVVASVCTGAVILAEAGVLDGRAATTHHSSLGVLRRFAAISVREQARWTMDGRIATSAGIAAGIDLALALVADRWGRSVAQTVADNLEWHSTEWQSH